MNHIKTSISILIVALFTAGGFAAQASACGPGKTAEAPKAAPAVEVVIADISVEDLATQIKTEEAVVAVVDVNNDSLRQAEGKIPGAILLSNYKDFDASELPADKQASLVFYCASEQCGASHKAAKRAQVQGYDKVQVLKAGIMGWKQAGQQTETVAAVNK